MRKELEESQLLIVKNRAEWRLWLEQNYHTGKELWLVYFKPPGSKGISYDASVEEALCFGWIDSTIRRIDETRYARRFTPRKAGTPYSPSNLRRLSDLIAKGLVAEDVLAALMDKYPPK